MGSNLNFKNFGNDPIADSGGGGRPPAGSFPLARQSSIYSLTFEEFQSTVGGSGKDFGSMNMDELLKSIWSAEENQNFGFSSGGGGGGGQEGGGGGGYLQRQGSLTLPRTLSQKTVDEVWRDMSKDASGSIAASSVPQRQPTLGEITLEEFLVRAGVVREETQLASGVVREETQLASKPNNLGSFGDFSCPISSSGVGFGYQHQQANRTSELMGGGVARLPLNVNGVRSAAQQLENHQLQQHQQQQILPKQPNLVYGAPMVIPSSNQLSSPRIRTGIVGISDQTMNNTMVQNGPLGMVGVRTGSPAVSSDGLGKSNGDTSSVSPVPYVFNGGIRSRKSAALEKVVERRQRRMIKNRESAARSRARKQAYTMELEAEVAKLKEEHEELQKKQAEMMEMQKNQVIEMMKQQNGAKRQRLRRTQTGPW